MASLPNIVVPWEALEDAAADMASRAQVTAGYLTDASAAWQRFRDSYHEPQTEERVWTALDDLSEPTENWQRALQAASDVISTFTAAGRLLEQRRQALQNRLLQEASRPVTDDGPDDGADETLDDDVAALAREWTELQENTAASLAAIGYGDGSGLPMTASPGGSVLPTVGWSALTAKLDDRFGALNPELLLRSLRGLDEEELRAWGAANPEAAALLAARTLMGPFRAGSPEALMMTAMGDGAHLTEKGIAGIRDTWLGLSPEDQERLMLLYPAVFGSLNGIPFAQRAKTNLITLAGFQHTVREQLAALKQPTPSSNTPESMADGASMTAHNEWVEEKKRLEELLKGLDYAAQKELQVVMLSLEGNGQVVTMTGTPSEQTRTMATLVPGTEARLAVLDSYTRKLENITGPNGDSSVSFYWQGTDLPQRLIADNKSPEFNEAGAPLLAAFDFAVDLEIPAEARTTYVAYSAGGSMTGTAEREGLDSTNIVYVAPAGPGHNVNSPADTANPDANRYWLQTRDDPIWLAQELGGGAHGGSFLGGGSPTVMDPIRLETGFIKARNSDELVTGHGDYFSEGSTSAENIRAVINNSSVSLFVEEESINTIHGPVFIDPMTTRPEDFSRGKLEQVPVKGLED